MQITDLSKIPPPDVVQQIRFEDILAERKARFIAQYPPEERDYWRNLLALESEPVVKLLEECAYSEMLWRQELNEAAQSLLLAYAAGADLDQLAANVDLQRFIIQTADPQAEPPREEIRESDEALRRRVQAAFETLSTAGPQAAYESFAANAHPHIKDVRAVSPRPAEVEIAVLSHHNGGRADEAVLNAVREAVNAKHRRPVADRVTVLAAEIIEYRIEAELKMFATPDYEPVLAEARRRLEDAVADNARIGRDVDLSMIYAALRAEGVQGVKLTAPAANIAVSDRQAALCTGINIRYGGFHE
ncbi:MAG: baseplate J/gp47 family protein [Neisseria sp.]|nr:baseplate J/gp47 family protein [Neisseria sp.]